MPVFVSALLHKMFDGLFTGLGITSITKLPAVGAKSAAQVPFFDAHVFVGSPVANGQCFQRDTSASFRHIASFIGDTLKELARACGESRHSLRTNGLVD